MDKQGQEYQWLEWAKELQFIAQAGLTYTKDLFDKERFERIREISAEIMSLQSKLPLSEIKDLFCNETGFQTPKLDTRAAIFKDNKISSEYRNRRKRLFQLGRTASIVCRQEQLSTNRNVFYCPLGKELAGGGRLKMQRL